MKRNALDYETFEFLNLKANVRICEQIIYDISNNILVPAKRKNAPKSTLKFEY